ncbi:DUF2635 domain-containing protein [Herbaspirillum sp. 3R11]|nr:DUF2635 domain-containing protein [Herbaspirillum sp. 3R-3a1]TFI11459.1 DUF2635 domain-containing protein [Herbaspirillum sp. 3R11]TFI17368.1 DUF2635 domain-containing protein [Herbaspirillum sp. 3R-11]TFI28381.1 DUF2635 domain-containing protein [Herbaspirillum sp. 3C11]
MFVVPVAGRIVPDPERGGDLAAEGRNVPRTPYWLRAVTAGDVKETKPAADKSTAKGKAE